ncbi:MAG: hypothetical protein ACFFAN_09900 [Promethearchaeota archaeon]
MIKKEKEDDGPIFRISASQALKVAEMQIEKCRRLREWRDAYAVKVFPLFSSSDKEEPSYYEVKTSTPSNDDAGTVIISATDMNYPIIGFRTHGRSLSEEIISKSDYEVKRIIWHGLNAVTGENEAGKEIISLGHKPTLVFDLDEYEEYRRKHKEDPLPKPLPEPKKSEEFQDEWKEVKKVLGLIKSNPYGVTADSFKHAWGWSRHANLKQYDLPNGESVGCAAVAWTALLLYHDMYWDPDLLYGTHDPRDEGKPENIDDDDMSDYIKRSMKKFHDVMGTRDLPIIELNNTWAYNIKEGFKAFEDYHCFGNLDFDPDDYSEWDWEVFFGAEPGEAIQDLILELISRDTPVIVGLGPYTSKEKKNGKKKKVAHYCLGLAWAKNDNGKLKFVLCDELHGKGQDDLYWWHRSGVFGAWGIPRGAYNQPRWRDDRRWERIDLSNLGNEIYAVGIKHPENSHTFLIRRGPAAGFPIPVKGTNAKSLKFDESIEVPVFALQGSEVHHGDPSITTWLYRQTFVDYLVNNATMQLAPDYKMKDFAFTREDLANILLQPKIPDNQIAIFKLLNVPYLFLAWPDYDHRIHIAYAIIPDNLEDISFKHVLLPERFRHYDLSQTPIAIAQDVDRTGPMLYIAYQDFNMYYPNIYRGWGRLVIIKLDLFFQIAETGDDLWPQDTIPNLTYTPRGSHVADMRLTDFKWHWPRLNYHTSNLRLSSNGKEVALLWETAGNLYIHWSYTFESQAFDPSLHLQGSVHFGNCILEIAYAKNGERFLHDIRHKETLEDYAIGNVLAINADILYGSTRNNTLIAWSDNDSRILISKINRYVHNGPRRAELLADLFKWGSQPKLAIVKDELDNRNVVMTFSLSSLGRRFLHSRILFFSGIGNSGITDFDALPK